MHHHINQGKIAAGIPRQIHLDNFSALHPNIKIARINGALGGFVSVFALFGDLAGAFTGNPDSYVNLFSCHCQPESQIGRIQKEFESGAYYTITGVTNHYEYGKDTYDTKTVKYNLYSNYAWDDEEGKYVGIDLYESRTEVWKYDSNGAPYTSSTKINYKKEE